MSQPVNIESLSKNDEVYLLKNSRGDNPIFLKQFPSEDSPYISENTIIIKLKVNEIHKTKRRFEFEPVS